MISDKDNIYSIEQKVREILLKDISSDISLNQIISILSQILNIFSGANTLTSFTATNNGLVNAGSKGVAFIPSSNFVGTVNGVDLNAALTITPEVGKTLPAINYTVTTGSLRIDILN